MRPRHLRGPVAVVTFLVTAVTFLVAAVVAHFVFDAPDLVVLALAPLSVLFTFLVVGVAYPDGAAAATE